MTSSKIKARLRLASLCALLMVLLSACVGGGGGGTTASTQLKDGEIPTFEDGTTMKTIQDRKRLIVGVTPNQAPFASQNPNTGSWEGFDIEVAYQIARSIFGPSIEGKVQFIPIEARDREAAISERRVDLAVGRYVITVPRKRFVDFAGPYYIADQSIITRTRPQNRNDSLITSPVLLNGQSVCTATGSTNLDALKALVPGAVIVNKSSLSECAASLISGETVAIAADRVDLIPFVSALGRDYGTLTDGYGQEPYGIGVRLNNTAFRSHINDALENWEKWSAAYQRTTGDREAEKPAVDRY